MLIRLHEPSLVLLMGPSGSGKSTFARRHFRGSEVVSSDFCRELVCDDGANQAATNDAFELLHSIVAKRLQWGRTTVIDATNVQASAREPLARAARERNIPLAGIVFALTEELCQIRNHQRAYRRVPAEAIQQQCALLEASLDCLTSEGFGPVLILRTLEEVESVELVRVPHLLVTEGAGWIHPGGSPGG